MIKPILEYNGIIWGDKGNTVLMDSLQVFQSKAAKAILNRDLHSSATQALEDLNWLPLYKRRTIDRCFFVYKCLNNFIDHNFDFNFSRHAYNTRNKNNLIYSCSRTNWGNFRTVPHCSRDWNNLNFNIRSIENIASFERKLIAVCCNL